MSGKYLSRCISPATYIISSRDGVIRPDKPMASALTSLALARISSQGTMTPRIDDFKIVALQNDSNDVFADIVNIALDRGNNDLSVRLAVSLWRFSSSM